MSDSKMTGQTMCKKYASKATSPKIHTSQCTSPHCTTKYATAAPNIYIASAMLHLYLVHAHNSADNGMPRAIGWGKCWRGTTHFSLGIMNMELQEVHSFTLYLDSARMEWAVFLRCALFAWWQLKVYIHWRMAGYVVSAVDTVSYRQP